MWEIRLHPVFVHFLVSPPYELSVIAWLCKVIPFAKLPGWRETQLTVDYFLENPVSAAKKIRISNFCKRQLTINTGIIVIRHTILMLHFSKSGIRLGCCHVCACEG